MNCSEPGCDPTAETMELTPCPEEGCEFEADIIERRYMNGAPMPVEVVLIRCPRKHWFRGDADTLLHQEETT